VAILKKPKIRKAFVFWKKNFTKLKKFSGFFF
jgi:hypothetical protein